MAVHFFLLWQYRGLFDGLWLGARSPEVICFPPPPPLVVWDIQLGSPAWEYVSRLDSWQNMCHEIRARDGNLGLVCSYHPGITIGLPLVGRFLLWLLLKLG